MLILVAADLMDYIRSVESMVAKSESKPKGKFTNCKIYKIMIITF